MKISNMKHFILIAITAFAVTNCGDKDYDLRKDEVTENPLHEDMYGSWKSLDKPILDAFDNEIGKFEMILTLSKDSMTLNALCQYYGQSTLKVEAISPITITDTHINISKTTGESKKVRLSGDLQECSIKIERGYMDYKLHYRTLILQSSKQKGALILNKI